MLLLFTLLLVSYLLKILINNFYSLPSILYRIKNPILSTKIVNWKTNKNINNNSELPNIILIIVDDLGINDLGTHTPNINNLYKNGMKFNNFYSGHATCAPSRVSILTGKFPSNTGFEYTPLPINFIKFAKYFDLGIKKSIIDDNNLNTLISMENMVLPLNYSLISNILHNNGYYNYFLGKWHIGEKKGYTPIDRGYDESLAFLYGASLYSEINNKSIISYNNKNNLLDKLLNYNLPFAISHNNGPYFKPNEYMTDYLTNNVVDIIENNKNNNLPFFITLAYNAPHNPYQALLDDFNSQEISKFKNLEEKIYYSMIKAVDRGVNKIINKLKICDKYENTIIIFTSDNGGAHYSNIKKTNYPYKGFKSTFNEGGIKVPLFIQYPKLIKKNVINNKISHHTDIFVTLINILNKFLKNKINIDNLKLDGKNLLDNNKHKILFWKSGEYMCLRFHNWKIILSNNPNKLWIYNLNNDPYENLNLINNTNIIIKNKLLTLLNFYNSSSKKPLWNSVIKVPIPINDNNLHSIFDEYIYWSN
jgi:arylsulfatase A-like enzyme